jgi:NAD(P)-dependent dehydrogenase (short-subunit alcohol dehydrogenase family)
LIGATGGIGAALTEALRRSDRYTSVIALSRHSDPPLDLENEESIRNAASAVAARLAANGQQMRLLLIATGYLHGSSPKDAAYSFQPERSWSALDVNYLQRCFELNAVGPALLIKHLFPLLARDGRCVAAALSARVGSIGDNKLGGWYGYRAAKAALNQLMHTAAIELTRRNPQSVCVVLHPGTVDTTLSQPFAKTGLNVRSAATAATDMLAVLDRLTSKQTGGFFDYQGAQLPW